jgi:hypothetical protein
MTLRSALLLTFACFSAALLSACGGGSSDDSSPSLLVVPGAPLVRVSATSPFAATCAGGLGDTLFMQAEVEPMMAVDPTDDSRIAAVWQEDRWSGGGSHGLVSGLSIDGGKTWSHHAVAASRCGGGISGRASNPWLVYSPDGTAYLLSLSFTGFSLTAGASSGQLVFRSTDHGATWGTPVSLIHDGSSAFDDKGQLAADPNDSHFVYAVWDRITNANTGPTYFSRTTDGGATWEAASVIYDPGANRQTISNEIVVLSDGSLLDFFVHIDLAQSGSTQSSSYDVIRSTDHGQTWTTTPTVIAQDESVGTQDPDTGKPVRDSAIIGQIAVGPGDELVAVWQDARFSKGDHDGVAFSISTDAGVTWSKPVEINGAPQVAAFTPSVHIRGDGTIGVSYYDFRSNTSDPANLPTDYWLTQSTDGVHWKESHVSGPFDLSLSPVTTMGYFLGDYQALAEQAGHFVPMFAQTNDQGSANPTDIYFLPVATASAAALEYRVPEAEDIEPTFQDKVRRNLDRALEARRPPHGASP